MFETDVRTDMFWCEDGRFGDGTQLGAIIRDQDRLNQTFRHGPGIARQDKAADKPSG